MHIHDNREEFPGKVFYVKGEKRGTPPRENTVDEEFHKFQGIRGSANISRVENEVASNSDAGKIGILFMWSDFANHFSVCGMLSLFNWDVLVTNHNKCGSS